MSEKIPYEQVMGRMRMDIDYIAEEAYQKGFEAGQHEATTLEYQQGLNDAWETVRKLYNYWYGNDDIFGDETFCEFIFQHSASEVIDRIKAYEESQKADEIKVGDEVIPIDAIRRPFVVVSIENNAIYGFELTDGFVPRGCHRDETHWEKTGRHFPQVAELVKAMKEGAE